ncbi:beta strand repeat-containing protein [Flavobacterium sp. 3HN19-14]|uniref:beta strand repeat-containing protein n=1 Tax=Flavobacterium sp. 3HN19-14 TaxID=3448133 RepID=UPI003EE272A8
MVSEWSNLHCDWDLFGTSINGDGCTVDETLQLTITPLVTPTFTPIAPVCSGGSLTLPTTSDNGYTGSWSPTADNTATTTYTFTPTSGQCATTTTLTVTVNPSPTLSTVTTTAVCQGNPAIIHLTGLLPNTAGTAEYTHPMLPGVQSVSGTSNASGEFDFTTPALPLAANNTIATLTKITNTATGCATTFNSPVTLTVNPTLVASVSISATDTTICTGTSVTFTATPTNGGTPTYQWKVNGSNVLGETTSIFTSSTLANNDSVTVEMTSNATPCLTGSPATSNAIIMTVNPTLVASVSIIATATTICTGTSVTFTATPTNGGTPTYQWKVNGSNVLGETASTFTSSTLANNDSVTVEMTSNATPCLTGSPATSNAIIMTVNPTLVASVSIIATATTICTGTSVTFTATPTNGGTPTYQWKVNGSNVLGETASIFTTSTLANADSVTVEMISNATPCMTGSPATSNAINMIVNPTSIGGTVTGGATICSGQTSGVLTLSGHVGNVVRWESSTDNFANVTTIANTSTTYTSGALTQTTQFRAVVQSGVCTIANSTSTTVTVSTVRLAAGTYNIPGCFATVAAAVTRINTDGIAGPVVFAVAAGYTETAPPTGIALTATGTLTNTITFVKSGAGANPTINAGVGTATPSSAAPDGIFSIRGGDYITIDGFTFTDGNAANPATMEFGVGLFKASATDGANNNTIKNCVFNMQRVNNASGTSPMVDGSVGILAINATATAAVTSLTPSAASGTNSFNKFYSNIINGGNYGIVLNGFAASAGVWTCAKRIDLPWRFR